MLGSDYSLEDAISFTIMGVPVTFGNKFKFLPIPGADPSLINFLTDDAAATEIWEKSNQVVTQGSSIPYGGSYKKVDVKWKYETLDDTFEGTLHNLCLIERRYSNRFYTELVLSDVRIKSLHRRFYGRYNFRRQQSNVQLKVGDAPLPIFEDRWVFPVDNYLDWSVNGDKPHRAIELIDKICKLIYGSDFGGYYNSEADSFDKNVDTATWTDVCPDNLIFGGESVQQVLNRLLLLSRTSMNVFPEKDGKIYCYELAEEIEMKTTGEGESEVQGYLPNIKYTDTDSELIYRRDMSRFSPDEYWVYFPPLYEIPLIFDYQKLTGQSASAIFARFMNDFVLRDPEEQEDSEANTLGKGLVKKKDGGDAGSQQSTGGAGGINDILSDPKDVPFPTENGTTSFNNLWNVASAPYTMDIDYNGKTYRFAKGSYLPIQVIMAEIGLPEEFLLNHWFQNLWRTQYLVKRGEETGRAWKSLLTTDKRYQYVVSSIAAGWWKTFMIHPKLRKCFGQIEYFRTEMENWEYSYRQRSPLWFPYIDTPSMQFMVEEDDDSYIPPVAVGQDIPDLTLVNVLKEDQAPFEVTEVSQQLGIFKIQEVPDLKNLHVNFEPGIITEENMQKAYPVQSEAEGLNWTFAPKESEFRLVTLLTARPVLPNNISQNYLVKVKPKNVGSGGVKQIVTDYTEARFSWDDDMTDVSEIRKEPQNLKDLIITAQAEQNLAEYQFMPWYVGNMIFAGTHGMNPRGNIIVGYEFGETECKTIIQANVPSPPQTIYPLIGEGEEGQKLRRKLAHELPLQNSGV